MPFQVRLLIPAKGYPAGYWTFLCGGTIVSPNYVLTAAHCLQQDTLINTTGLSVYVAGSDFSTAFYASNIIPVRSFSIHPFYTFNASLGFPNDLAMLQLNATLNVSNPLIGVVCLPYDDTQTFAGANLTTSGWGLTSSGDNNTLWVKSTTSALKGAFLKGISNEECSKSFGSVIGPYHICASGAANKSSICLGDSGGNQSTKTYIKIGIF
jgi:secreted trypsin-like serine protease